MKKYNKNTYKDFQNLISEYQVCDGDDSGILNFGKPEYAPKREWISIAEKELKIKFPPSYLWFLENYGEGEIAGDELLTVCDYDPEDEAQDINNIIYCNYTYKRDNLLKNNEIIILPTGFDEEYIWKTDEVDEEGEFPVYLWQYGEKNYYAENYISFLVKYIKFCVSTGK